jgi:Fungal Zn(2)-Cys(6) binuclear cluster domain/Fungal specific transcription factor domain
MATKAKPAHRRACARCRKRKIRCDAALPACQACVRVGVNCMGYDPDPEMNGGPRSLVLHLEEEVAALEIKLRAHEAANIDIVSSAPLPSLAQRQLALSNAIEYAARADSALPINNHDALVQSTVRLAFQANASRLPLPFTYQQSAQVKAKPMRAMPVHQVPRTAAELLLKNYTDIHLPQYPCISEVDLSSAFQRCMEDGESPSAFDVFIVSMAMAISASTMLWKHENNALATSAGFWAAAKTQLEIPDIAQIESQQLECCLLMTHYGFTNPGLVDVWYCIGDAVRICLQLGYERDLGIESGLNDAEIDSRRRLFWTTCAMEWSVCAYTRIPPTLAEEFITTKVCDICSWCAPHVLTSHLAPIKSVGSINPNGYNGNAREESFSLAYAMVSSS